MDDPLMATIRKFFDYAHLGKLATDFAPGLLIAAALLIGISTFTQIEVLPYFQINCKGGDQDTCYLRDSMDARAREIAVQGALDAKRTEQRDAEIKVIQTAGTVKEVWRKKAEHYKSEADDLSTDLTNARKEAADAKSALGEAGTLGHNLNTIKEHVGKLILLAFILGVILAQASGGFFYNGLFHRHFKKNWPGIFHELYPNEPREAGHYTETHYRGLIKDKEFLKGLPDIQNYYRYLEVAMNMILPVFTLAALFMAVYILQGRHWANLTFALAALIVGYGLYRNARAQYVGYFIRKKDLLSCLRAKHKQEEGAAAGAGAEAQRPPTSPVVPGQEAA